MPYYPDINTLHVHIPKTGGSSIEEYLEKKSSRTLFGKYPKNDPRPAQVAHISLQHQTYRTIDKFRDVLKVPTDCRIISVVRNPYDRIVSELLYKEKIKEDTPRHEVYLAMQQRIEGGADGGYDNHTTPQYEFVSGDDGELIQDITIFRTESLTQDLHDYGYEDYVGPSTSNRYPEYFNADSIALINKYYEKDFELFGYPLACPEHGLQCPNVKSTQSNVKPSVDGVCLGRETPHEQLLELIESDCINVNLYARIILARRTGDTESALTYYRDNVRYILSCAPIMTLVSLLDTYADDTSNPARQAAAVAVCGIVRTERLARRITVPDHELVERIKRVGGAPMWDSWKGQNFPSHNYLKVKKLFPNSPPYPGHHEVFTWHDAVGPHAMQLTFRRLRAVLDKHVYLWNLAYTILEIEFEVANGIFKTAENLGPARRHAPISSEGALAEIRPPECHTRPAFNRSNDPKHLVTWEPHWWFRRGTLQFEFLKDNGLEPHHNLLDYGCGPGCGAERFISFLEPGNYLGLDIDYERLIDAKQVETAHLARKKPRFAHIPAPPLPANGYINTRRHKPDGDTEFDLDLSSVFGTFDFAIAQSVFTHNDPAGIAEIMGYIDKLLTKEGVFFATCFLGTTRVHADRDHYYPREFWYEQPWSSEWLITYIGDWGHSHNSKMLRFVRNGELSKA